MKVYIVYDDSAKVNALVDFVRRKNVKNVVFFSLSGNAFLKKEIDDSLKAHGININHLNSVQCIEREIKHVRGKICKWSATIGKFSVRRKEIKEWFLLPGCNVSTWWFGLLSEKNTLKTKAFLHLAQVHAIKKSLDAHHADCCIIDVKEKSLKKAIKLAATNQNIKVHYLSFFPTFSIRHIRIKEMVKEIELVGDIISSIYKWFRLINRGFFARRILGARKVRFPDSNSLLFVSYFPAVEKDVEGKGIFRNKYAIALQDKLEKIGIPICWLLMCVQIDGFNYRDAVKLAQSFSRNGEKLFILDEFINLKDALIILFLWLRQCLISLYLFPSVRKGLLSEPFGIEGEPILKSLWRLSFCGIIGFEGITYSFLYKRVFSELPDMSNCIYYCEMHAWEKALNAAKEKEKPNTRTIGFQHSFVSRNHLFYFYDQTEARKRLKVSDLPLPDVLACNGEFNYSLMQESTYPGLTRVEAVRQMYLNGILSLPVPPRNGKSVLLIAGSIDKNESRFLIAFINEAFPRATEFEICFKGHPAMPFEGLFNEVGIDVTEVGYSISRENIAECLKEAQTVLVPSSSVAIEALAFGCEVIVPSFPNTMQMNPLADFEGYYHKVTTPEELREVMVRIAGGEKLRSVEEYRDFVRKYWYLDPGLPRWEELLTS